MARKVATNPPSRLTSVEVHSHQNSRGNPETLSFAARFSRATDTGRLPPVRDTSRICKWHNQHPQLTDAAPRAASELTGSVNRPPQTGPVGSAAWPTHRTS